MKSDMNKSEIFSAKIVPIRVNPDECRHFVDQYQSIRVRVGRQFLSGQLGLDCRAAWNNLGRSNSRWVARFMRIPFPARSPVADKFLNVPTSCHLFVCGSYSSIE